MDCTHIYSLLDKYWECGTTVEEERELRRFFSGSIVPPDLLPYKSWFVSGEAEMLLPLGEHFDAQVMADIEQLKRRRRQQSVTRYLCLGSLGFVFILLFLCLKLFLLQ